MTNSVMRTEPLHYIDTLISHHIETIRRDQDISHDNIFKLQEKF